MTHIIETEIIFFLLTLVVPKFIQEKQNVTARCSVMEIIRYQELLQKSKTDCLWRSVKQHETFYR